MRKIDTLWVIYAVVGISLTLGLEAYGHEGGGSSGEEVEVSLLPNPNVPEFVSARGTALINLRGGVVRLQDLEGFPTDAAQNRVLPVGVTHLTDPRFTDAEGNFGATSCQPQGEEPEDPDGHTHGDEGEHDHEEAVLAHSEGEGENPDEHTGADPDEHQPTGPWICHVHSYVVWLAELEGSTLHHPILLATIYPQSDGTATDRNFSFRDGDISGFGINVLLITAEATFGGMPSIVQEADGTLRMQMAPSGPVVLKAMLP